MKEQQNLEWKEVWRDEYLRWICGFANAEGEVLVIGRNDQGRAVGGANAGRLLEGIPNKVRDVLGIMVSEKTRVETSEKTSEKILQAILENEEITIADLAKLIAVTTRSVERNIRKLQEEKKLRRIGPDKGGRWEVLK